MLATEQITEMTDQATTPKIKESEHSVFIGNLSYSTKTHEIETLFSTVAKAVSVRFIYRNQKPKGFGFASFATAEECDKVVAAFNDKEINGRELKLQIAVKKEEKPKVERPAGEKKAKPAKKPSEPKKVKSFSKTILFVGNLPFEVTDKVLENLFVETGLKIKQAKIATNANNGRSKGFGFVEFEDESALQSAIEKFAKAQLDGRELEVKPAFEGTTF